MSYEVVPMSRSYNPGVKLPLIVAGSPLGGIAEVAVSGDRRTYYRRYPGTDSYQRVTLPIARVLVETMVRDCDEVPERLRSIDERLVQELRGRTDVPDLPARGERSTNWSRRFAPEASTFTHTPPVGYYSGVGSAGAAYSWRSSNGNPARVQAALLRGHCAA